MNVEFAINYTILCLCGRSLTGVRTSTAQRIACPACGQTHGVYPATAWPAITSPAKPTRRATTFTPLLIGAIALLSFLVLLSALGIGAIVWRLRGLGDSLTAAEQFERQRSDAEQFAQTGSYALARDHFQLALIAKPDAPPAIKQRAMLAALLADLSGESLGEIARRALGQEEAEWQRSFAERFAGRAFLFDTRLRRNGSDLAADWQSRAGSVALVLDLNDLLAVQAVPLAEPQRVLFGARLATIDRSNRDVWHIRLQPESGALFTESAWLTGLSVPPDAELRELVERQAGWAGNGPVPAGKTR